MQYAELASNPATQHCIQLDLNGRPSPGHVPHSRWQPLRDFRKRRLLQRAVAAAGHPVTRLELHHSIGEHEPAGCETPTARINLPDKAVALSTCIDSYQKLPGAAARADLLQELARVTSGRIVLSVGVGTRRDAREIEAEFAAAGLVIARYYDLLPGVGYWRLYLLKIPFRPRLHWDPQTAIDSAAARPLSTS